VNPNLVDNSSEHFILKMFTMVRHKLEGDSKVSNDMVKEESGCGVCHVVECWHSFNPFGEVVNDDYYVFMPIVGWGVASHEINTPFAKGACRDDWMEGSGWCSRFMHI
jgi:hypothetical protein